MKKYTRFKGSLKISEITDDLKTDDIVIGTKGHNSMRTVFSGQMNGEPIYVVETADWGFDDVSESSHAFKDKAAAMACFDYYNKSISELMKEPNENGQILLIYDDGTRKNLYATAYKGYVCQSFYDGDYLKPFFNVNTMNSDIKERIERNLETIEDWDIRDIIGTDLEAHLLRIGENLGKKVYTEEIPEFHPKHISFTSYSCWETDLTYYVLTTRLPKEIFNRLGLWYHKEEIEEEGNWKGWCVGETTQAALAELSKEGWTNNLNDL